MSAILRNKWVLAAIALALVAVAAFVIFDYDEALEEVSDYGEDVIDNIFDGVERATMYIGDLINGVSEAVWYQIRAIQVSLTNLLIGGVNAAIATVNDLLPGNPIPEIPYMDFRV